MTERWMKARKGASSSSTMRRKRLSRQKSRSTWNLFTLVGTFDRATERSGGRVNGYRQLTDALWAQIAPLMPIPRGNCTLPSRQVPEGWLFIAKEGCSWRALDERYGPWHTVHMRGRRWIDKGVLERVFAELQRQELDAQLRQRDSDRPARVSLDSTIVKVHQVGTGAPVKGGHRRASARAACRGLEPGEA